VSIVIVTPEPAQTARLAHVRYGKGIGHRAELWRLPRLRGDTSELIDAPMLAVVSRMGRIQYEVLLRNDATGSA
jgi:hypothetical protein